MSKNFFISEAFSFAWNKFKEKPKFWILVMAMIIVFTGGTSSFSGSSSSTKSNNVFQPAVTNNSVSVDTSSETKITIDGRKFEIPKTEGTDTKVEVTNKTDTEINPLTMLGLALVTLTGVIVAISALILYLVVNNFVYMGSIKLNLDAVRNNHLKYETLLSVVSVKRSLKYLGAAALYILIIIGGLLLFVIPGFYFAVKYSLFFYAFVDKELGIIDSLKYSARLTKGVKFKLLGFYMFCGILMLVGLLAFIVGAFFAGILIMLATAHIYEQLLKGEDSTIVQPEPAVAPVQPAMAEANTATA